MTRKRVRVTINIDAESDVTGDFVPDLVYTEWAEDPGTHGSLPVWLATDGTWQGTRKEVERDLLQAFGEAIGLAKRGRSS